MRRRGCEMRMAGVEVMSARARGTCDGAVDCHGSKNKVATTHHHDGHHHHHPSFSAPRRERLLQRRAQRRRASQLQCHPPSLLRDSLSRPRAALRPAGRSRIARTPNRRREREARRAACGRGTGGGTGGGRRVETVVAQCRGRGPARKHRKARRAGTDGERRGRDESRYSTASGGAGGRGMGKLHGGAAVQRRGTALYPTYSAMVLLRRPACCIPSLSTARRLM